VTFRSIVGFHHVRSVGLFGRLSTALTSILAGRKTTTKKNSPMPLSRLVRILSFRRPPPMAK
jgi:hypothetical protein